MANTSKLRELDDWFRDRGMSLLITREEGECWAHLLSARSLEVFAPRYGRGTSPEDAAARARERYEIEQ